MAASPTSQLDPQAVSRAVDSLLKWVLAQNASRKTQLLQHDQPLRLVLSLRKIPSKSRTNPHLIPLPHPLSSSPEVCLFTHLPSPSIDQQILSQNLPISQVIPLDSLRSDYKPFEARRKLRSSYDVFLADRSLLPLLPRLIGNSFFKKKKHPLPIDLSRKGWPEQIKRCLGSSSLYIRSGTCCQLDVGRASMGRDQIVENVVAAVEGAIGFVSKKWDNVRSIHLKFDESVALPVYRALPEVGFKIESSLDERNGQVGGAKRKRKEKKTAEERELEKKESERGEGRPKKGKSRQPRYIDNVVDDDDDDVVVDDDDDGLDGEMVSEKKKKKKLGKSEKPTEISVLDDDDDDDDDDGEKVSKKKKKKLGKSEKPTRISARDDGDNDEIDDLKISKKMKKLGNIEKPKGSSAHDGGDDDEDGEKVTTKKMKKKLTKIETPREISVDDDDDESVGGKVSKTRKKVIRTVKPSGLSVNGGELKKKKTSLERNKPKMKKKASQKV
ncbi:uncharacterized protein LOC144709346 [Wolffia australiana]